MRDGWVETTLGEVCKNGLFADGDWVESKDQDPEGDYRLLQLADIGDGVFLDKSDRWMNKEQFQRLGCTKLEVNDVLIARMPDPIGRACLLPEGLPSSATVVDVAIVRTGNEILQRILSLIVNSPEFRNEAFSLLTGTTRQRISRGNLSKISFWLPPLPEQKRIVDLISSVDSYIEALQQQLESAKRSRNAVLRELLTAGGDDWKTTTIGEISDFVSVRKSPGQLPSDSIYVGLEHLKPNNTSIDNFDSISKVTSSLTPFDVGDVLFGRLRPYLHKVAIAEIFGFCSPEILVLRANAKVLPQMLLLFCDADSTIKICVERSAGTRMPRTSTEDLASIEIKLPPMAEQINLAELFSTFDTEISQLGIALEKSKILRSGLLSDLLSGNHEIPASYDKVIGAA